MRARSAATALLLAALSLPGLPAAATSYVPMTDEALAAQAPLAAVVTIERARFSSPEGRPATDYTARVEQALKGDLGAREITVRVPGGIGPHGIGLRVWGAPRFTQGERALLFLVPRRDGTFVISQLMLGAFHEVRSGGRRFAVRDLAEARAVGPRGGKAPAESLRDFDRFAAWVARPHRADSRADYRMQADPRLLRALTAPFTFLRAGDGFYGRWLAFDTGGSVVFLAHQNGQPGLAGGGFAEFQTALAAWTADAGTNISYTYGGTTANTADPNTIAFDQDLGSPFSCTSGGVLGRGSSSYTIAVTPYHGQPFHTYLSAHIDTNQGIACYFQNNASPSQAAAELFAHELGHTLGLNHSCGDAASGACTGRPDQDAAQMRAVIHNDGRGAQLNVDDRTGIAVLYTPAGATPAASFFTVPPCRLLDTRTATGGGALSVNQSKTQSVLGLCGIPGTATAIVGNVTAVTPTGSGSLTLAPASAGVTGTTSVTFSAGNTRASQALIGLSGPGSRAFTIRNGLTSGVVDVIVDVTGYFQ